MAKRTMKVVKKKTRRVTSKMMKVVQRRVIKRMMEVVKKKSRRATNKIKLKEATVC